jgi:hypothetical protein
VHGWPVAHWFVRESDKSRHHEDDDDDDTTIISVPPMVIEIDDDLINRLHNVTSAAGTILYHTTIDTRARLL